MASLNDQYLSYANGTLVSIATSFITRGVSAPDTIRDGHSFIVASVTRVSAGLYEVTLDSGFPIPELPIVMFARMEQQTGFTKLCEAKVVAGSYSSSTRKFRIQVTRSMNVAAWSGAQAVTANAVTLATAGTVISVHATVATAAGPKSIMSTAAAAGQVQVAYTAGVPTLTFAGADAVTSCVVQQIGPMVDDPDTGDRVVIELIGSINSAGTDLA